MRVWRAETLTELHDKMTHSLIHATADKLDVISGVDVQVHHVMGEAQSMDWEFDLKWLWLTPSRWTMMVRQYVPREEFLIWLEKCTRYIGLKERGTALMRTQVVKARGGAEFGNKESRRWGSCMISISYQAIPQPTITLFSRTSYLGYLSGLDISVAWMMAKYLAAELGCKVEDFKFVWMNQSAQYHNFKSMAYLLNHPDPERRKKYRRWLRNSKSKLTEAGDWEYIEQRPALMMTRKWLSKLIEADLRGDTLGDMSYNTYRRIRRRYHTEVLGYERAKEFEGWSYFKKGPRIGQEKEFFRAYLPLASVPVSGLDFSGILLPWAPGEYSAPDIVLPSGGIEFDLDDDDE